MDRFKKLILGVLAVAFVTASCSSSDGGGDSTITDTTAPTVTSTIADTTVVGTADVYLTFSEVVTGVPESVVAGSCSGSIQLADSDDNCYAMTITSNDNTAYTLNPTETLVSGNYTLTVGTGVTDSAGNALELTTFSFTVRGAVNSVITNLTSDLGTLANAADIVAAARTAAFLAVETAGTEELLTVVPAALGGAIDYINTNITDATSSATLAAVVDSLMTSINGAESLSNSASRSVELLDSTGFSSLLTAIADVVVTKAKDANTIKTLTKAVVGALGKAGATAEQLSGATGFVASFVTAATDAVANSTRTDIDLVEAATGVGEGAAEGIYALSVTDFDQAAAATDAISALTAAIGASSNETLQDASGTISAAAETAAAETVAANDTTTDTDDNLDSSAPTNASVLIDSGSSSTTSTNLTLLLSASDDNGVIAYYVSESSSPPTATSAGWFSMTSSTNFTSSASFSVSPETEPGSYTKTVYVWFKDVAGNVSNQASDSINLVVEDSNPSLISGLGESYATHTITGNEGTFLFTVREKGITIKYTITNSSGSFICGTLGSLIQNNQQENISFAAVSYFDSSYADFSYYNSVLHNEDTCATFANGVSVSIDVYMESAMNMNTSEEFTFYLNDYNLGDFTLRLSRSEITQTNDIAAPSNASIIINSGDSSTAEGSVTLSLSATDNTGITGYYVSESNYAPSQYSDWVSISSTTSLSIDVPYTFSYSYPGNAETIYVWFRDEAGNISDVTSDNIDILSGSQAAINSGLGESYISYSAVLNEGTAVFTVREKGLTISYTISDDSGSFVCSNFGSIIQNGTQTDIWFQPISSSSDNGFLDYSSTHATINGSDSCSTFAKGITITIDVYMEYSMGFSTSSSFSFYLNNYSLGNLNLSLSRTEITIP